LQVFKAVIDFFAKGDVEKFVFHGFVEPFTKPVGLR